MLYTSPLWGGGGMFPQLPSWLSRPLTTLQASSALALDRFEYLHRLFTKDVHLSRLAVLHTCIAPVLCTTMAGV